MTLLWLIIWLVQGTPALDFEGNWNNWAISLVVCAVIDIAR